MTGRLAGLDIGFSATRASSGIAILADGHLRLGHHTATNARDALVCNARYDVLAIDGPCVPAGLDPASVRPVERLFSSGIFAKRCKPGLSHVSGTGRTFRACTTAAATELQASACRVVEAFPHAFLAVCLPNRVHAERPALRRGRTFDWLYDQWVRLALVDRLMADLGTDHPVLTEAFAIAVNHDRRAALVCLLTALCVARGRFTAVGEPATGWFHLPAADLWEEWAWQGQQQEAGRLPGVQVVHA